MNLLGAKVYFDGFCWIAIPHTERNSGNRKKKSKATSVRVSEFEKAFKKLTGGRAKRKAKLLTEFTPMFKDIDEAAQFVEEHFDRLSRNRWERYKRMIRRAHLYQWNYFCTFTYDDKKHTEEQFKKKIMNTLYHFAYRKGWRYIAAWERGELGERLHLHALVYIPEGGMPGELEEHNDFSTKKNRMEKTIQNSFFNKKFGRSHFSEVHNSYEVADSIKYMLKYITKSDEKVIYSRGIKTYIVSDIQDEDIICPMGDEEHGFKYILAPDFTCIVRGEIVGKVCPEVLEKMPKSN